MDEDLEFVAGSNGVSVHAGFPNPAAERLGRQAPLALDINRLLVKRPSSTYLFKVSGHHWADVGVYDGDVAVIDRAVAAKPTDLIIAWQDSGFVLCRQANRPNNAQLWGVITATIRQLRPA